jgi:hypothetical protein
MAGVHFVPPATPVVEPYRSGRGLSPCDTTHAAQGASPVGGNLVAAPTAVMAAVGLRFKVAEYDHKILPD